MLEQTWQDMEVIILDDCSTDNSKAIIEKYRDHPKLSGIVYNERNSGSVFKQWQKGISLAGGELIWMAESDDWCEKNLLEVLVDGFVQNSNCVIAYAQSYWVDDSDNVLFKSSHPLNAEYINGQIFFKQRLAYGCTIYNASMAVFKRSFALQVQDTFTQFRLCGDWLFWISMSRFGDIFISGQLLNYFRRHDGNVSSKAFASGYNFLEEMDVIKIAYGENMMDTALFNRVVYNKYNNFLSKKERFAPADIQKINAAFYDLYGSRYHFYNFLFSMKIKAKAQKFRIKLHAIFKQVVFVV